MMAAWDAFRDIATYFDEEYEGGREMVSQFLMTLEEDVPFSDMGMNAWI
jgi:DNA-directed RNA polymerase delta subunit